MLHIKHAMIRMLRIKKINGSLKYSYTIWWFHFFPVYYLLHYNIYKKKKLLQTAKTAVSSDEMKTKCINIRVWHNRKLAGFLFDNDICSFHMISCLMEALLSVCCHGCFESRLVALKGATLLGMWAKASRVHLGSEIWEKKSRILLWELKVSIFSTLYVHFTTLKTNII